jgi:DNA-binding transcriptional MerR regulator
MSWVFGRKAVIALAGISKMQLEHWDKRGIVKPSVKAGVGKGTRREYSFQDVVALKVARRLREEGISLQKIRRALAWLRKNFPDVRQPLAELRLVTDGVNLFVLDRDPGKILDVLKGGQFVFSLALGQLIEGLQGEIKKLATIKEEKVMAHGGQFTVTLTPDLEDGGYTGQCREIPGAVSQGETEQEALDNIIEVLEEHLEYERGRQAGEARAV